MRLARSVPVIVEVKALFESMACEWKVTKLGTAPFTGTVGLDTANIKMNEN